MRKRGRGRFSREEVLAALGGVDVELERQWSDLTPQELLEKGQAALDEYDYELAHNLFKLAVLKSEGDEEAVCRLAMFLVDDYAAFDEAIAILSSPSCSVNEQGLRLLARSHFLAGHKKEALEAYEEVNAAGWGDALSWKHQGMLLLDLGRPAEAVAALGKALEKDPTDTEAERLKGEAETAAASQLAPLLRQVEACLDGGRLEEAERILGQMAKGKWLPPEFYRLRSRTELAMKEVAAQRLVEEARLKEREGDLSAALDLYRKAQDLGETGELVAERIRDLDARLMKDAAASLVERGCAQLSSGDRTGAIQSFYMGIARDPNLPEPEGEGGQLFRLVREFHGQVGRMPSSTQVQWLDSLFAASLKMERGELEGAELDLRRAGSLAEQLPSGVALLQALADRRKAEAVKHAQAWLEEGRNLEEKGLAEEAARLYERAAQVEGFQAAQEAADRARSLRERERAQRELGTFISFLEGLMANSEYFRVIREIEKSRQRIGESPEITAIESHARASAEKKYPMKVTPIAGREFGAGAQEYNSGVDGVRGFSPDTVRVIGGVRCGAEFLLLSGRQLALLNTQELQLRMTAELPPQADLTGKAGFVLAELSPGDFNSIVVVNFDDDLLLHFTQKRSQLLLRNAMPVERMLQQSRQKVMRWFVLNGREDQLVVCQSAPGSSSTAHVYSLALSDGRMEHTETHGVPLCHLRTIPSESGMFLVHRHPEPLLMQRPNYFSFALLDSRMRIVNRYHIAPDDLEGAFIESTRWVRFSQSGRMYFFFRYFDSFTGQIINRPLAFVAMEKDGSLVYALADSSQLVKGQADLDPIGELIEKDGGETLVMLGRKEDIQYLFIVDLERFRVVESYRVPDKQRVVGVTKGSRPGMYVTISLSVGSGEIIMKELPLP